MPQERVGQVRGAADAVNAAVGLVDDLAQAGHGYAWIKRPACQRARQDAELTEQIRQVHTRSRGTYGAPRVHAELRLDHGVHLGRKRVARRMRSAGLVGCHRRRGRGLTRRDLQAAPAPDLVNRQFMADAPDRVWTAEITDLPTQGCQPG